LGTSWNSKRGIVTAQLLPRVINVKRRAITRQEIRESHLARQAKTQAQHGSQWWHQRLKICRSIGSN
jgi:hypothetical protein